MTKGIPNFSLYNEEAKQMVNTMSSLAQKDGYKVIDIAHLFTVLINNTDDKIPEILQLAGANLEQIQKDTNERLQKILSIQGELSASLTLNTILEHANTIARDLDAEETTIYHILLSLLQSDHPLAKKLAQQGIGYNKIKKLLLDKGHLQTASLGEILKKKFWEDLTELAKAGKLKSVIGREEEFHKMIEILARKERNNVLILWEPGVGKTAIAELLAQKITAGEVPDFLKNKKILKVNLGELISGSKFRGEFEERVSALIQEAKKPEVLLFIDEFHNINGAGKSEGSMGFSDLLKPELSSGNLQVIGATTTEEYRKQIEKDSALSRRFENLTIPEPTNEKMLTILRQIEQSYEKHHGVIITDNALVATVELSDKYIKDRKFPDKAIAVLDQAAARVHLQMTTLPLSITQKQQEGIDLKNTLRSLQEEVDLVKNSLEKAKIQEQIDPLPAKIEALETEYTQQKENWEQLSRLYQEQNPSNAEAIQQLESVFWFSIKNTVERDDIAQIIAEKTGIPVAKMQEGEEEKYLNLETELSKRVVGQDEAVSAISNAIRTSRIELSDKKKPMGSYLFLWPTGVGKTELAKALAQLLFGDEKALIRFNMSEFQEEHSSAKLIGAPAGYVGYEEGGDLTNKVREKPYSVLLFDEIEKAHPKVFDLFLQVLDDGMLNDNRWKTVDFKNTIIIMTSNIGSREIMESLSEENQDIGDLYPIEPVLPSHSDEEVTQKKRNRRWKFKKETPITPAPDPIAQKREQLEEIVRPELLEFLRPEFLNRLDDNIIFNPISREMFKQILEIQLNQRKKQIAKTNGITLEFTHIAKNFLAKKWRDPKNGARPIGRALDQYLRNPLAKEILWRKLVAGDKVNVEVVDGALVFQKAE